MEAVSDILSASSFRAVRTLATWFLPLAVLTLLLHICQKSLRKSLTLLFGERGPLVVGIVGIPLHELSHAAMCIVFRHRIRDISLFRLGQWTGTLGYVRHSYNECSFYQGTLGNLAIGVAPLFGGALVLYLLSCLLVPGLTDQGLSPAELGRWVNRGNLADVGPLLAHVRALLAHLFHTARFVDWRFYTFLLLSTSIGAHLAPSDTDWLSVRGPLIFLLAVGFAALIGVEALGGLTAVTMGTVTSGAMALAAILLFALVCCSIMAVLFCGVRLVRERCRF